jgi:uncharacterized membrane protein (UPF0127 family)
MAKLIHGPSGATLAERLEIARSTRDRMRGLLGRDGLPPGGGMLIERCSSIHTFFMKFPIDVIFIDAGGAARKAVPAVGPWRLVSAWGAQDVVELPAGTLARVPVAPGDALRIEESP